MGKKIFISHASADEKVVSLFVDHILFAGSGVKLEDIVYTTRVDTGIDNGEDIPSTIRKELKECELFVMMVSNHYRNSEVCLNEMGAAWMREDLQKLILLLPGIGFDRIGWLMSLSKGTQITDADGLDQIHDQVVELTATNVKTATWNRSKAHFLDQILIDNVPTSEELPVPAVVGQHEEEEEMDILDMREGFETHTRAYSSIMTLFSGAMNEYSGQLSNMTKKLNHLQMNPQSLTPAQLRGVFVKGAQHTDDLSCLYEEKTPEFRYHFDRSIEYAIKLQQTTTDDEVKEDNKRQFKELVDTMISAREELNCFRKSLDEPIDLDKHFKKSQLRLRAAMDNFLDVVSFCISRSSALL